MRQFAVLFRRGFGENVRFAFNAIREHKLRSGLTILGIVVGVTTVIAMVAIVTGFNNNVIGNLQAFGATRVEIQKYEQRFGPGGPLGDEERRRRNLTPDDVQALRDGVPQAAAVSGLGGYFDAEIHVKNGNLEANSPYVLGADEQYPTATAYTVGTGRFLTRDEVEHNALVTILGADVRDAIFPGEDPIGKDVTINGLRYRVIGVLDRKGEQFGYSPDNKVVIPYGAFKHQFSLQALRDGVNISLVPKRPELIDEMIEKASAVLRAKRKVPYDKPNDFAIITPDQLIGQFRALTGGVTIAMIAVALVSLVVGGVGVMNIMLVSVTQRTREIGVRKAVRRLPARHRLAVPDGGGHAVLLRRRPRRAPRRGNLCRCPRPSHLAAGGRPPLVRPRRPGRLDERRHLLRPLPRRQSLPTRPHRIPPIRVAVRRRDGAQDAALPSRARRSSASRLDSKCPSRKRTSSRRDSRRSCATEASRGRRRCRTARAAVPP